MTAEHRLWRSDNMTWAMAPADIEAGQSFEWAGRKLLAISVDGRLRYREMKSREASDA